MFQLVTRSGEVVTMRDGRPFRYSTQATARMGARYLSTFERGAVQIVPVR